MRKFSIMDKLFIAVCVAIIGYSISGCAKKIVNESESAKLAVRVPISAAKLAAATQYGRLTITAPDIDSALVREMMVVGGNLVLVGDTVTVPVGPARTISIEGFGSEGLLLYSGTQTIDVSPGVTYLEIRLTPAVPMVNLSPHFQQATFFGDTFAIDVYAHGIDSLTSIDFNMNVGQGPYNNVAIELGSNLPDSARIWNEGPSAFGIYMQGPLIDYLTDSAGNAHLATLRFVTYNDWNSDTALVGFNPNISSMYGPSGPINVTTYTDDAQVLLIGLSLIGTTD